MQILQIPKGLGLDGNSGDLILALLYIPEPFLCYLKALWNLTMQKNLKWLLQLKLKKEPKTFLPVKLPPRNRNLSKTLGFWKNMKTTDLGKPLKASSHSVPEGTLCTI